MSGVRIPGQTSEMGSAERVMVAVDESEESMEALTWALSNVRLNQTLILLHVQTPCQVLAGPGFYTNPGILDYVRKYEERVSQKVLSHAKMICNEKNVATETMLAHGDPRDAICEAIEKLHVDFLVIGSHGYGAIKRAFLGSVSDYCAHNAKCPVVIVKKC